MVRGSIHILRAHRRASQELEEAPDTGEQREGKRRLRSSIWARSWRLMDFSLSSLPKLTPSEYCSWCPLDFLPALFLFRAKPRFYLLTQVYSKHNKKVNRNKRVLKITHLFIFKNALHLLSSRNVNRFLFSQLAQMKAIANHPNRMNNYFQILLTYGKCTQ